MASKTITVDGMACGGCEDNVVDALLEIEGVSGVTADHEAGTVVVDGDAPDSALSAAIEEAGYEVVS